MARGLKTASVLSLTELSICTRTWRDTVSCYILHMHA